MKTQALFSSKDKSKKLKCRLLQFLLGALRVNEEMMKIIQALSSNTLFGSLPFDLSLELFWSKIKMKNQQCRNKKLGQIKDQQKQTNNDNNSKLP